MTHKPSYIDIQRTKSPHTISYLLHETHPPCTEALCMSSPPPLPKKSNPPGKTLSIPTLQSISISYLHDLDIQIHTLHRHISHAKTLFADIAFREMQNFTWDGSAPNVLRESMKKVEEISNAMRELERLEEKERKDWEEHEVVFGEEGRGVMGRVCTGLGCRRCFVRDVLGEYLVEKRGREVEWEREVRRKRVEAGVL